MALSPREKLAAAAVRVSDAAQGTAPYFGVLLLGLVRCETSEIPTLAVSKAGVLYWNPKFVEQTPSEILAYALQHEVMHVALRHHERTEAVVGKVEPGQAVAPELRRKLDAANWAQDACINENLREIVNAHVKSGKRAMPLPDDWIYPETLEQDPLLTFERRYALLLKRPQQKQKQRKTVGAGECGSCSGRPADGEPASGEKVPGRSQAEMDRFRRQTAEAVHEHVRRKGRGTVPAGLQRWADELLGPPKVDWRRALSQQVRAAVAYKFGAVDACWTKISRRQGGLGFGHGRPIMPAFRAPVPDVAVIVDTSGSMGEAELSAACAELSGILQATGAAVTFLVCDAAVHGLARVRTLPDAVAMLKGGGGTSMTPAFTELDRQRQRPDVIVVLTDGYIGNGYPEREPQAKTIWVVVGGNTARPCPWGAVVCVDETGTKEAA